MGEPRLIQTYLPDGSLEGVRIIELSESALKGFVVPRLKLNKVKSIQELAQPALYLLLSADGAQGYVGETRNFYQRVKNHDQAKTFWDVAIAFVSNTNTWEKGDVEYLEARIVELANETGSIEITNKTIPIRNKVHEFKLHSLGRIAEDIRQVTTMLGYNLLSTDKPEEIWYCNTKKTNAKAVFRGDQFVILAGSKIDSNVTSSFRESFPAAVEQRLKVFVEQGLILENDTYILKENVTFRSPNIAGGFAAGRNVNAWTTWKNKKGETMDEVMRQDKK